MKFAEAGKRGPITYMQKVLEEGLRYEPETYVIEDEDGIKKYGKSKEHRPNPIVQMGMFMDGDGIPLAFSLFPVNANGQTSIKPLEEKILNESNIYSNKLSNDQKKELCDILYIV